MPPRPACGERAGVRGLFAARHAQVERKIAPHPESARIPTYPRKQGEVTGRVVDFAGVTITRCKGAAS